MTQTVNFKGSPVDLDGTFVQVGATAPDFALTAKDLSDVTLAAFAGKKKVLNIFPSIDTPVCASSVRQFNQRASTLDNTVVLCISTDLPFAQDRFCGAEGMNDVITLSDFRHPGFGENYGVRIASGPFVGLNARAVVVLNEDNKVLHAQLVSDIVEEPDYDTALLAVK